jgi:predicted small secreted protein
MELCRSSNSSRWAKQGQITMRGKVAAILLNLLLLSGANALLCGCNTTAGVGKDVSAVGHAVTTSADKVKSGL